MGSQESFAPELEALVGQQVVVDTTGPYLYIGVLKKLSANAVLLADVDVHDSAESSTSNDLYLIEALKHGVRPNRRSAYVLSKGIVSISPLSDVLLY